MAEEIIIRIDVQSASAKQEIKEVKKSTDELSDSIDNQSKSVGRLERARREATFQESEDGKELAKIKTRIKIARDANNNSAIKEANISKDLIKVDTRMARKKQELAFLTSEQGKEMAKLDAAIAKARIENIQFAASQDQVNQKQGQFRTQSGLQNAILLESGRLASDLSFGFTAIANNLSQLVSLTGSFIDTTGDFVTSMKQLGKSLLGTGGVLLAVQLFIAALQSKRVAEFVKSLFGATEAVRALRKALGEATDSYGAQIGKLETLTKLLEDKRLNDKQRANVLKELKKDNEDLNIQLDENNQITEKSNKQIEARISLLKVQAETQALVTAIEQERVKQLKLQNSTADENITFLNTAIAFFKNYGNTTATITDSIIAGDKDRRESIKDTQTVIDNLYEQLVTLVNFDTGDDKGSKRRLRRFKQQLIDLSKTILDYEKQASKIRNITAQEQLDNEERFAVEEANRKKSAFIERQKQRLEEYKEQVKDQKNAQALIKDAEMEFRESVEDAETKHKQLLLKIEDAYITERILLKEKEAQSVANIERKIENLELSRLQKTFLFNEDFYDKKRKQIEGDINLQEIALASTEMSLEDRKKAELNLEKLKDNLFNLEVQRQNKLLSQNELLNSGLQGDMTYYDNRLSLLDEFITKQTELLDDQALSEEQRDQIRDRISQNQIARINTEKEAEIAAINARTSVNQEYINFAQGMSSLFSTIAGENEDLQNAALVVEKGAAIADIVVRTQAANAQIVAGHSAAAAIESATVPFTAAANIATQAKLGTAQVARNNVSAGISIANILATTLTSFKKPSAGASTASQTVQAPAFNVVGPSTTDQLLNTVGQNIGELEVNLSLNEVREGISTLNNLNVNSSITGV